ncbi:MAG: hypothetical protein HYU71_07625 [Bacteroidetes bacterium]|nr:hypothetical protein [Bacteroidota bacterium]
MKKFFYVSLLLLAGDCSPSKPAQNTTGQLNQLAEQYVRLGLTIGQYDEAFVDAYYGPDSLRPQAPKAAVFPKDSLLKAVAELSVKLQELARFGKNDTLLQTRTAWIQAQLTAFTSRIRIFSGQYPSFEEETKELFGVTVPTYPEKHFRELVAQLNNSLPGKGNLNERFQQLANRFIIPKEKLNTVFRAAIAECRKRTKAHYELPVTEDFTLEYVTNKPWSGYNWYKGRYQSLVQINTDLNIFIEKAIDVGSHESYPGHHVYNMLLEKNLYQDKGWLEISLYPLFSPQSLIAEGSANYGIDVTFPGKEKNRFAREVLLPLAGLDTTGLDQYFAALELKSELNYARNEVARGLLNGTMTETEALRWLQEYGLNNRETALKSISFIRTNRSYVINYNYGKDLVKNYIESNGGTDKDPAKHWQLFAKLLSNPVTPADLLPAKP